MRIPKAVKVNILSVVDEIPDTIELQSGSVVITYVQHADVPDIFAYAVWDGTDVRYAVTTEPNASGLYAVTVTLTVGWALIVYDDGNTVQKRLWFAGYPKTQKSGPKGPPQPKKVQVPHPLLPVHLEFLMKETELAERTVAARYVVSGTKRLGTPWHCSCGCIKRAGQKRGQHSATTCRAYGTAANTTRSSSEP